MVSNNYKLLVEEYLKILDVKARLGCTPETSSWEGCQNCNGTEIGKYIERLIKKSKKYLEEDKPTV